MKIFYITTTVHLSKDLDDGLGSTTHTFFVARELTKLGHEVHVISKRYEGEKKYELIEGIQVHRLKRGVLSSGKSLEKSSIKKYFRPLKGIFNLILAYQINKLDDRYGCDVILERNHSLGIGAWTSYLTGKPMILEVIDSILSSRSLNRARSIIAYTNRFFDKKHKDKVRIVNVGYDPETFYPEITKNKYDICYTGSFKPWDGVEDMVEAVNLLVNKYKLKNLQTVMVGTGEQFDKVVDLVKDYNLDNNIEMAGKVKLDQVRDYINSSRLCVAPYNIKKSDRGQFDKYGFYYAPLKVVEYMACGKPVVATKYVMIKNILHKDGAEYFKEGNIDDLARKIRAVLQADNITEMGESNLMESRKYSWQNVVKDIDKIIRN